MISSSACVAGLVFIHTALAQTSLPINSTAGCPDVNCPVGDDNDSLSSCQVVNNSLLGVGISAYKSSLLDFSPTWTLGLSRFTSSDDSPYEGTVQRTFYLGTRPDQDFSEDATGCSLFILANGGDKNATLFSGSSPELPTGWKGPTCGQPGEDGIVGLPEDCVSALQREATNAIGNSSPSCSHIADTLNSQVIAACNPGGAPDVENGRTSFLGQSSTVYAVPLTGDQSPELITSAQNSTSDCWPTLPQTNDLAEIFAFNISTTTDGSLSTALAGITPVLNVWHTDSRTEFEALCIEPVLISVHDAATMNAGTDTESTGSYIWPRSWPSLIAGLLSVILYC